MNSLQYKVKQYEVGLLSKEELQKFIDFENLGSDTTYYTYDFKNKLLLTY